MTTIAWDGKTLASDSQLTDDFIEQRSVKKLFRVKGSLIGVTGDYSSGLLFVNWFQGGELEDERPKLTNFSALVVRANGEAFEYDKSFVPIPAGRITAIGSGRGPALGALLAGANAVEAVHIAKKVDPDTGGLVKKLTLPV